VLVGGSIVGVLKSGRSRVRVEVTARRWAAGKQRGHKQRGHA